MKKHEPASDKKSRGTVIAEKARAKANGFTDKKRSGLIEQGMSIIRSQ